MPTEKRQRKREGRQMRQAQLAAARRRSKRIRQGVVGGILVALVGVLAAVFGFSHDSTKVKTTASTSSTSTTVAGPPKAKPVAAGATLATWSCPKPDGSSPRTDKFPSSAPPMCIDPAKTYTAKVATSEGEVDFTLDTKKTPKTANNFAVLSLYHYYDGTSIDRIDTSLDILQTGSPHTQDIGDPGPGYSIPDEGTGFKYQPGDVVMARTSSPNSASAQYFYVVGPKAGPALDAQGTYVTFGHVTKGLDVLQKIEGLYQACSPTDQSCMGGAPSRVVTITGITITAS